MFVVLELLDQPFDVEVLQIFCDPRCCYKFHHNFSTRSMVPKVILLLGFVDLVDHIASSILARLLALSELSAPIGRAPLLSFRTYSFVNTSCKQCIVENDCM